MTKLILILLFLFQGNFAHAAWLGTWAKRVEITVSNTNVDADETWFPLLLTLGTSVGTGADDVSFIFDELTSDANRTKIAVTLADGTSEIKAEIERWVDADEDAWLWVSKSDFVLDADAATTLYLYYDSAQSANTTNVGDVASTPGKAVWNDDYIAVYHMQEAANVFIDSKQRTNDHTTTDGGTNNTTAAGIIGTCAEYGGAGQAYLANETDFDGLTTATINYIYFKDGQGGGNYGSVWGRDSSQWGWGIRHIASDAVTFRLDTNARVVTGSLANATWHYLTFTYSDTADTSEVFEGITSVDSDAATTDTWLNPDHLVSIGDNDARAPDGKLDEMRISDVIRSDAWIKSDYYSKTDGLVSWGTEETIPATGVPQVIMMN